MISASFAPEGSICGLICTGLNIAGFNLYVGYFYVYCYVSAGLEQAVSRTSLFTPPLLGRRVLRKGGCVRGQFRKVERPFPECNRVRILVVLRVQVRLPQGAS